MPVNTLGQENSKEHNRAGEKLQRRQEEMNSRRIDLSVAVAVHSAIVAMSSRLST